MQALGWGFPVERFAWAAVEFDGDRDQAFKLWTARSIPLGKEAYAT